MVVLRPRNTRGQPTSEVRSKVAHVCVIMWHVTDSDLNPALSIMTPMQTWCQFVSKKLEY